MLKNLVFCIVLFSIPILAQTLKLKKLLSDNGIKIEEIAAFVYANVKDKNVKSAVIAEKFILPNKM